MKHSHTLPGHFRVFLTLALALGIPLSAHSPVLAQKSVPEKSSSTFRRAFREVVAQARESTVQILCDGKPAILGTIISADGWIVTKDSELHGELSCQFSSTRGLDRTVEARKIKVHEKHDLALLKIKAEGLKPIAWRDSKTVKPGGWLASVGTDSLPVAVGVVSVATRDVSRWSRFSRVNPFGGFLGIATKLAKEGVTITRVVPKTAASKAGLKVGDVLITIHGQELTETDSVIRALWYTRPGDVVRVRVQREDEAKDLKVTLGKRPGEHISRSTFQNNLGGSGLSFRSGFPTILQHDTVLKPAECGGPLVDLTGKAVGINIARAGRTESYAIPSEIIRPILADVKSGKVVIPAGE